MKGSALNGGEDGCQDLHRKVEKDGEVNSRTKSWCCSGYGYGEEVLPVENKEWWDV